MSGPQNAALDYSGVDPLGGHRAPRTNAAPVTGHDPERWEPRGTIGLGGMGTVTIMYDRKLGRQLAVKTPASADDAVRLEREALITARIEHPGIIAIYDTGLGPNGTPWYSMRLVRGQSLAVLIGEGERLLRHVLAAAEAVAYAHARGVVHRDLKPANIMVGSFGETQVIDWGLALAPDLPSPDLGRVGTLSSMSPEQARGGVVDARADVFALGTIVREVVTGQRLFATSDAAQTLGALDALAKGHVPPLTANGIAPELRAIIERAMAPDPAARYADAKAFADDLERYLDGRRVSAYRYTSRELFLRLVRAWRVPLVVAGVGLVLLAIVLAVSVGRVSDARDLAEKRLAYTLVTEARQALADDDRGRAEVLAREALSHATAEARGVLMALPHERPRRTAMGAYDGAVDELVHDGAHTLALIRDAAGVTLVQDGVARWTYATSAGQNNAAVLIDDGQVTLLFDGRRYDYLATQDGRRLRSESAACPLNRLESSADRAAALAFGGHCAARVRVDGNDPISVDGCHGSRIRAAALSDDGLRWTLVCADGAVTVGGFDGSATRFEAGFPVSPQGRLPTAVAFEDAGTLLVGNDGGELIRLRLADLQREVLAIGRGLVRDIVVDGVNRRAVAIIDSEAPRVIDLGRWGSLGRIPAARPGGRARAAFGPDGAIILADRGAITQLDYRQVPVRELVAPLGISALAVSAGGDYLAFGWGARLDVLATASRTIVARHQWQSDYVKTIAFGPGDELIGAALGAFGMVRLSPLSPLPPLEYLGLVKRVGGLADGTVVIVDYGARVIHLSRAGTSHIAEAIEAIDLATSPDGRHVALTDSNFGIHYARASDLVFTRVALLPGALDLTVDDAGVVRAINADTLTAWYPDSTSASWVSDETVRVPSGDFITVAAAAGIVAIGSRDGAVRLWRDGVREPWAIIQEHRVRADTLVIEPHGRWIASGAWDGHVHLLHLAPSGVIDRAEAEAWWGVSLGQLIGDAPVKGLSSGVNL